MKGKGVKFHRNMKWVWATIIRRRRVRATYKLNRGFYIKQLAIMGVTLQFYKLIMVVLFFLLFFQYGQLTFGNIGFQRLCPFSSKNN